MQEACDAHPGTMAAILGLEREQVAELCTAAGASLCNENAPGNVSIGGTHEAVERASAAASAAGARRVVPLNVAGAFHTPLMDSAAAGMRAVLAEASFGMPAFPIVSNVTGQPMPGAEGLAKELGDQITSPVLWVDSVQTMLDAGVTSFTEFGPGRVLTGALARMDRSASLRNVATAADARGEGEPE